MTALNIVVIEDEPATARNLVHFLKEADGGMNVVEMLSSVNGSIEWFNNNPDKYDLVFMDIRLADGSSFDIFNDVEILKPVIFVTAYNEHALQAFKNNGIDYILKPFDQQEIKQALNKFKRWMARPAANDNYSQLSQLIAQMGVATKPYKRSFLVHYREKLIPVEAAKIAWFYTANEIVYAQTADAQQYHIEFTMEQLEQQLDPAMFYRANRQFIINRKAITEVDFYFNGRLALKVKPETPEKVLVSKARAADLRRWMDS